MIYQKSFWIWNYGDYEIFHSNRVNSRREQYGADYPCFWKLYGVDQNVKFYNDFTAEKDGTLTMYANGMGYILIDGDRYPSDTEIQIKKGNHNLKICVTNLTGLPSAYIKSDVCATGKGWHTLDGNLKKTAAGFEECYDNPQKNPEVFPFEYKKIVPCGKEKTNGGILFDFGKETFGYLLIGNVRKTDKIHVSYGESKEEALDLEWAILSENVSGSESYKLRQRAFRYIFITGCEDAEITADYEYLPLEYKGSFECNDDSVNKIWDMCAYTLHLTSREVQLEAVKRDRWLWGGDAYQAYKFSNYLFFDQNIIKRSTIGLRGKEPFDEHINTITDYSFFWVIGLKEYYMNYKNTDFIKFMYPKAVTLMKFSSERVNRDGFITGKGHDWIFIDWADIDKDGAISAEQLLYIEANRTMAYLAGIIGEDGAEYTKTAAEFTAKTNKYFWDSEKGAYIDTYESGKKNVTRHANIFAVMYGIATEEQKESIIKNVLLNSEIPEITTPYFEGYELDTFGIIGNFDYIENKINTYWKGMLDLGATTVWEEYNPELSGTEHYRMYRGKYAKSLCHAWGAAPIYLLGKYFLGVSPDTAGFETFSVKPHRGGFKFIKGTVPIYGGEVKVYLTENRLSVTATKDGGTLIWNGKKHKLNANEEFSLNLTD